MSAQARYDFDHFRLNGFKKSPKNPDGVREESEDSVLLLTLIFAR
jgi:hypothetical protein